jgi:hypothetical protein
MRHVRGGDVEGGRKLAKTRIFRAKTGFGGFPEDSSEAGLVLGDNFLMEVTSMTTWQVTYTRSKTTLRGHGDLLHFTGSREELVHRLEVLGFEVEDFTDQVDAFTRDARGRRIRAIVFMA